MKTRLLLFAVALLFTSAVSANVVTYSCTGEEGTNCTSLIPDSQGGSPGVLTSSMSPAICPGGFPFAGVQQVHLDIIHEYVGDLRARLITPSGTVTLFDRPVSAGDCASDDIHADFKPGGVAFPCSPDHPASGNQPVAPANWFTSLDTGGTWTLELTDYANTGIGALEGWSIHAICATPPTVTIASIDGNAVEGVPGDVISFQVTRSEAAPTPLVVPISVSGTATSADYTPPLPSSVTIPANETSVLISATATDDAISEGQEQLVVTIGSGSDYVLGDARVASAVIFDPPTPSRSGCTAPPADMISWWNAGGAAGDLLENNPITLKGGTGFGPGLVGSAFDLDGTNDYVEAPDGASLDVTSSFTVMAWVGLDSYAGEFQPIVTKWDDIGMNERSWSLSVNDRAARFDVSTDGLLTPNPAGLYFYTGASSGTLFSTTTFPLHYWTHVAATFNARTGRMTIYINGQPRNSGQVVFDSVFNSSIPVRIGAGNLGSNAPDYLDGQIDEVQIFGRALSDPEILAIAAAREAGTCALYAVLDDACSQVRAIRVGLQTPTSHCFRLLSGLGTNVVITDAVTSDWDLLTQSSLPELKITNSTRKIVWTPNSVWDSAFIEITTHPGKGRTPAYTPTACGAFYLDTGPIATVEGIRGTIPANRLCVAAVNDLNGGGIQADGLGDEDGDGVTDYEEACILGTNPCGLR